MYSLSLFVVLPGAWYSTKKRHRACHCFSEDRENRP
jgi:hypothetical protein